jgi:hypothetical protein
VTALSILRTLDDTSRQPERKVRSLGRTELRKLKKLSPLLEAFYADHVLLAFGVHVAQT